MQAIKVTTRQILELWKWKTPGPCQYVSLIASNLAYFIRVNMSLNKKQTNKQINKQKH